MNTQTLVIGVIKKGNSVLLRKKPDGAGPYKENWYLFGGTLGSDNLNPDSVLKDAVLVQTGISIKVIEHLSWDTEIKPDHSRITTFFIYLDCLCEYVEGELTPGEGIEKLEWVPIEKLREYDLVPPSVKLFRKLGYLL
jgi:8-oxo-dGTP pyrophosphatase MutT (NUDIX family)